MIEKAEELGRIIAQTPEYAYLQAAHREIGDDREAAEMLTRLRELQEALLEKVGRGEEPEKEHEEEFGQLQEKIQTSARYQALISSQANFDKLMDKVHRTIGEGIRKGEESRIILPS
ncbi:MAG: YlbF family regulator [Gemmatimonadota bacterium]|nr:YlbF family regulator [Gemmatimonadota bacterium]